MKSFFSKSTLLVLILSIGMCSDVFAQRTYRNASHNASRHYSRTDNILRGLGAVEQAAHYAMLGSMLNKIDDYTGVRLGFNSATLRISGFDDAMTESISGVNLGIVFGWYLGHSNISIEPGLYYSKKGGKLREHAYGGSGFYDTKLTMHSFEVPVSFKAHLPITPHVLIQPFAGPFFSFGFAGTTTYGNGDKYNTFDDGILEDFDAGIRIGSGLQFGHAYMEAAYDIGMLNLCNDYEFNHHEKIQSRTLSLSIGLNF